jgi:hypothetical protein
LGLRTKLPRDVNGTQENCTLLTIFQKRGIIEWLRVGVLKTWVFRHRGVGTTLCPSLGKAGGQVRGG